MTRTGASVVFVVVAGAMLISGCAAASPSTPKPSATTAPPATLAPSPTAAPTPTPTEAPSAAAGASASPVAFTSPEYGYTVTLPEGWTAVAAMLPWDGTSEPGHEEAVVDQFVRDADGPSAWGFAGPTRMKLADFVTDRIGANFRDHGDTCPRRPDVNAAITIDGAPGRFLAWNCGILINIAVTVHDGMGYHFAMRDVGIHAATDPGDRMVFDAILDTVRLPGS